MLLRVLGSMAVEDDHGRTHPVTSPRLRLILAILAVNRGQAVSAERLIELIWRDEPPQSAETSLQVSISQLRKLLEPDRAPRSASRCIVSRDSGYLLALETDELDLATFEALGSVAQERGATEQDVLAALEAWHDPPLAEFADASWALGTVERLRELRSALVRLRFTHAVESGQDANTIEALQASVAADPADQRLVGLLMVVLYRLGRQGEALSAYETMRRHLRDGHGLDPMPELRNLQQAVLDQDPRLLRQSDESNRSNQRRSVAASTLVGREDELERVGELLEARPLVTLVGAPGAGKTRLAMELQEREVGRRSSFVDLSAVEHGGQVVGVVADQIGLVAEPLVSLVDALVADLGSQPTLLILDNCEQVIDDVAGLASALQAAADVTVLATSRRAMGLSFEAPFRVEPLGWPGPGSDAVTVAEAPACRLLAERGFVSIDATNADALSEICRSLDGLPLAIELAGYRLRSVAPDELLRYLRADGGLRAPRDLAARHASLEEVIDASVADLTALERGALMGLSVFAGPVPVEALARLLKDDDRAELIGVVADLVDRGLAAHTRTGSNDFYGLLQTVRSACRRAFEESGDLDHWRERHVQVLVELSKSPPPPPSPPEADGSAELALVDVADEISAALDWLEHTRSDPGLHLRFVTGIGSIWYSSGRVQEARRRMITAVELYPSAEPLTRGVTLAGAGLMSFTEGAFADQRRLLGEAIEILGQAGFPGLEVLAAARHVVSKELDEAEETIAIALESPVVRGANRLVALDIGAFVAWNRGDHGLAIERLIEQEMEAGSAGNHYLRGRAMRARGLMLAYAGSPEAGARVCEESLDLVSDSANDHGITDYLAIRSAIALEFGNHDEARRHAIAAMDRASRRFIGPPLLLCLPVVASVEAHLGRFDNAARLTGWIRGVCAATGMYVAPEAERLVVEAESITAAGLDADEWTRQRAEGATDGLGTLVSALRLDRAR